jgi:hypothetical protein
VSLVDAIGKGHIEAGAAARRRCFGEDPRFTLAFDPSSQHELRGREAPVAGIEGLRTWQLDSRRTATGWRISQDQLDSPMRVVMPKAE